MHKNSVFRRCVDDSFNGLAKHIDIENKKRTPAVDTALRLVITMTTERK